MPTDHRQQSPQSSSADAELNDLFARIHAHEADAARLLYERYRDPLLRVIRRRYLRRDSVLRRFFDSDDLAQETWRRVFEQIEAGATVPSETDFVRLIIAMTRNRFRNEYRDHVTAVNHTVTREEPMGVGRHELADRAAGPAAQAEAADDWSRRLDGLSENERRLVAAVRDGDSLAEAAAHLGVSVRTIQRWAVHVRARAS